MAHNVLKNELRPLLKFAPYSDVKNPAGEKTVLQINTTDSGGGAARIMEELFFGLRQNGINTRYLGKRSKIKDPYASVMEQELTDKQKRLFAYQKKSGYQDIFDYSFKNIFDHPFYKGSNIVHLHNLHSDYFSLFVLPRISNEKKVVWTLHDAQAMTGHCGHPFDCNKWMSGCGKCPYLDTYPLVKKDRTKEMMMIKTEIYDKCRFLIVCPSKYLLSMASKGILNRFKTELIYNGIDTNIYYPQDRIKSRIELGLPVNKRIIMFAADNGMKNEWKGGLFIYNLYKQYINNGIHDILFLNVGGKVQNNSDCWQ